MKSRAIQTRFWDDEVVSELDQYAKYLFIYLLTCQYINVSGVFQLSEKKIIFETGMTEKQFLLARDQLVTSQKVKFMDGWVYVVNADKNNNYRKIPSNQKTYDDEWSKVPLKVKSYFESEEILPVNEGSEISQGLNINNKTQIINNKSYLLNKEEKENLLNLLAEKMDRDFAENELNKFISYWTEKNHSGTKERWQLEKTFEVQKRLATWFSRIKTYGGKNETRGVRL